MGSGAVLLRPEAGWSWIQQLQSLWIIPTAAVSQPVFCISPRLPPAPPPRSRQRSAPPPVSRSAATTRNARALSARAARQRAAGDGKNGERFRAFLDLLGEEAAHRCVDLLEDPLYVLVRFVRRELRWGIATGSTL